MRAFDVFRKPNSSSQKNSADAGVAAAQTLRKNLLQSVGSAFKDTADVFRFVRMCVQTVEKVNNNIEATVNEFLSGAGNLKSSVDSAKSSIEEAKSLLGKLQQDVSRDLEGISNKTDSSLASFSGTVESQIGSASSVLKTIEGIAQELKIIAINLSIEANRLGVDGNPVKSIATKVSNLASEALESTKKSRAGLDLDNLKEQLGKFQTEIRDLSSGTAESISSALSGLEGPFSSIDGAITQLADDQSNIFEVKKILDQVTRSHARAELIDSALIGLESHLGQESLERDPESTSKKVAQYRKALISVEGEDHLEEILSRRTLRVAIEPSFVGLSFRRTSGSPLQGLDVDMASAFAAWLGVRVEFVEGPWDQCSEFLTVPKDSNSPLADIMWSALVPDSSYNHLALSEPYCEFDFVLARRKGDTKIESLQSLKDLRLGCIRDPAAFALLESEGVRWTDNANKPGGSIRLEKLQSYTDQSLIHDCLAKGEVDAFMVDLPIYYWATQNTDSPWHGKIEICPGRVGHSAFVYSVGVAFEGRNTRLLEKVNEFIRYFSKQPQRVSIYQKWLGHSRPIGQTLQSLGINLNNEESLNEILTK